MADKAKPRTAVFAGTFNPFTIGHADIVERALRIFDRVVVVVGVNAAKDTAEADDPVEFIRGLYAADARVEVMGWSGLTVDAARQVEACALVRGIRSVRDFEYERDMADINLRLSGLDTVLLAARPELGAVSSSVVRELRSLGADVSPLMPRATD